jgi:NAD(P)H-hydrate epimerase
MKLATAEQMRNLDRQAIEHYRIPSVDLMERAAEGLCASALNLLRNKAGKCRAAVFCGSGNNGGDGIAAARLLFLSGVKTRVFLAGSYEKLTPDALEMTRRLSECGVELEPFDPASDDQKNWTLRSDLLVDALFGIGLCREIDPDSLSGAAVQWMNDAPGNVVAADIASGVAADTGNILGLAVRADETVTFTLPKIGHYAGDGGAYSGRVRVHDIGIPKNLVRELVCSAQLTEPDFVRASLPRRKPEGHKGKLRQAAGGGWQRRLQRRAVPDSGERPAHRLRSGLSGGSPEYLGCRSPKMCRAHAFCAAGGQKHRHPHHASADGN